MRKNEGEDEMKTKALQHKRLTRLEYFLFMIVPLLLGFLITLLSPAKAAWQSDDPMLKIDPAQQGWARMEETPLPPQPNLAVEPNSYRTAAR